MEKKSNLGLFIGLVVIVVAIAASVFTYPKWGNKVSSLFSDKEEVAQVEQTVVQQESPTIKDILDTRENIKQGMYYDSIFLYMPEEVLVAILMKKGTDLSNADIAMEYLNNKKQYDDVQFGYKIADTYKHEVQPDTIPKNIEPEKAPVQIE